MVITIFAGTVIVCMTYALYRLWDLNKRVRVLERVLSHGVDCEGEFNPLTGERLPPPSPPEIGPWPRGGPDFGIEYQMERTFGRLPPIGPGGILKYPEALEEGFVDDEDSESH